MSIEDKIQTIHEMYFYSDSSVEEIAETVKMSVLEVEELIGDMNQEEIEDHYSDAEADADTLSSCGWGTDEDYGYFGEDEY